jgi:hypothetical protein
MVHLTKHNHAASKHVQAAAKNGEAHDRTKRRGRHRRRLATRIYRPGSRTIPTLFPVHLIGTTTMICRPPLFLWREAGPIEWNVAHGYAYVHADVRGTGSPKANFGFMNAAEQQDLYDVIEWIAQQPWSNGKAWRDQPVLLLHAAMAYGHSEPTASCLPWRL